MHFFKSKTLLIAYLFTIRSGSNGSESITGSPAATEQDWSKLGIIPNFLPAKELNHFLLFTYILYLWLPSYYKYSIKVCFYTPVLYSVKESQGLGSGGRSINIDPDPQQQLYLADGALFIWKNLQTYFK